VRRFIFVGERLVFQPPRMRFSQPLGLLVVTVVEPRLLLGHRGGVTPVSCSVGTPLALDGAEAVIRGLDPVDSPVPPKSFLEVCDPLARYVEFALLALDFRGQPPDVLGDPGFDWRGAGSQDAPGGA
jgi:hypothetical protein